MNNWVFRLNEYVNRNASFKTLNRAAIYTPTILSQKGNDFEFECYGSMDEPYEISVWETENGKVASTCDCLYDGEGICKHQVAAINLLINLAKNKNIAFHEKTEHKQVGSTSTEIRCINGVIDTDELNAVRFNSGSYYYNPFEFTNIERSKIKAQFDDYRYKYELVMSYDKEEDKVILACSCQNHNPCYHKYMFFRKLKELFGLNYFADNFEELFKESMLRDKKLLGKVDFDDVFELIISTKGVFCNEKIQNVWALDQTPLELFSSDRKEFFIPSKQMKQEFLGVGLCLEFHSRRLTNVYPFSGKLNKTKTEITTKLRPIFSENFTETLAGLNHKTDQQFIMNALQLNESFRTLNESDPDVIEFKQFWEATQHTLLELGDKPIYLYKDRDTFVKKNVKELNFSFSKTEPLVKITENGKFFQLDFKIRLDNQVYGMQSTKLRITPVGIILNESFYPYASPEEGMYLLYAAQNPQLNVVNDGMEKLRKNVIQPLSSVFEIDYSPIKLAKNKDVLLQFEKQVFITDEEGEYIVFQPVVKYGDISVSPGSKEKIWLNETELHYLERNSEEEIAFITFLQNLHAEFKFRTEYFYLTPEEALENMWLMDAIEKLRQEDIAVFGMNNLKSIRYNLNKPTFSFNVSSGTDWFDLKIDIQFGDQQVDLKSLQKSIINKSNYVELKDGTLGLIPKEWIEKYKKYFQLGQIKKDKIEISNFQFNIIDELYEDLTNTPKFLEELYEKKKRLLNLSELKTIPKPKELKASLRPYQQDGLNWLVFLHENKLGGCLADDMGLGKTLQTIAFLQYVKNNTPAKAKKPHLVVAPTSLMFNWQAELKKFAPKLNVLVYIGGNRKELREEMNDNDIILTTYGSLIKDIHFHKEQQYAYVVLDESQAIKNPESQRFKAVRLLQCENRLALTGTPIENNTFDLYSQFNFLNPGIFGSVAHFRTNFSDAIDKEQDVETSQLLARMIHPFILRRTKTQVATELPPKTESVIYCEMGAEQRKVYDEFKRYFRQKLLDQIEQEGVNKSQMYILQGLTKLRQICNSTALADKDKDYGDYSTKLDELIRHLKEKVNNHKVLVFSQFVGMLQLVKDRLEKENIVFEYLDGQTQNREERVTNFQNNSTVRVFLISLKAGGTGLNLTEADYVYLIDPWWNPAVESQAIDRCYRIGQDKKVMAYRMICKDTIEEQIVQLQDKKKAIAADVIKVDTEKKTFNKKDVERFFG